MIKSLRPRSLRHRRPLYALTAALAAGAMLIPLQQAEASKTTPFPITGYHALSPAQRANLLSIASDTWKFYAADVDPATSLPMDNLTFAGGSATPTSSGRYTSASNIGVYLWAVVSARDLGLITTPQAAARIRATLTEVTHLKRDHGFLYQWYDTTNGSVLTNPGQGDCSATAAPAFDNCSFISNVDNGWYASGLIIVRQAVPQLRQLADKLISPMNFGLFYDARAETHCNTNPAIQGNQPTGQMFGGYYVGLPPDQGDGRWAATGRPTPTRSQDSSSLYGRATTPTLAPASPSSRPSPAACSRA